MLELSDLPGTPLSLLVVSGESFSDLPPPKRTCAFGRIRLSKFSSFLMQVECITQTSISSYDTFCSPSSCLRRSPGYLATLGTPSRLRVCAWRRSRLDAHRTYRVLRPPFHFLSPFIARYSPRRAFHHGSSMRLSRSHRFTYAAAGGVFRRWKLQFNQSRLSLSRAHKTGGPSHYRRSCLSAFWTCCFPLGVSPRGELQCLRWYLLSTTCSSGAIRCAPKRRTMPQTASASLRIQGVRSSACLLILFQGEDDMLELTAWTHQG